MIALINVIAAVNFLTAIALVALSSVEKTKAIMKQVTLMIVLASSLFAAQGCNKDHTYNQYDQVEYKSTSIYLSRYGHKNVDDCLKDNPQNSCLNLIGKSR